jgi:hypothetical protein
MRRVWQDRFGFGDGNCAWAALASIFNLDYPPRGYPPACIEDFKAWTSRFRPDLCVHERNLATNYRVVEGFPDYEGVGSGRWTYDIPETWEPPVDDWWIATVQSQSLKRPISDPYYPMPALHAVVMCGPDFVHDPNPRNEQKMMPLIAQTWWEPVRTKNAPEAG